MNRNTESHFSLLPRVDIQRSRFDRSASLKTSFNAGNIVPFFLEEVLPGVIFDGAHNLAAIREFTKSIRLQREVEGEIHPLIILFSAVADKDYSHMIELLCKESKADAYVIAKVDNKRGAQADTLAALFRKYTDRPVYREDTLADAFTRT